MLPISTSRPPRRRHLSAASVAEGILSIADHVEGHLVRLPLRRREEIFASASMSPESATVPTQRRAEPRERLER